MKKKELIKLINKAKPVFANVRLTENDCWYVQVVKSNLLLTLDSQALAQPALRAKACEDCGLVGFHTMTCSYYDPT